MSKFLKCKYCGGRITTSDKKCPNCGANVSDVVEEAVNEEEKERKEMVEETFKNVGTVFNTAKKIHIFTFAIIAIAFLGVFFLIFSQISGKVFSGKAVTVGFDEVASTKTFEIKCDEIDTYNMTSTFSNYANTKKEGYQQVAFHIEMKNKTNEKINFFFDDIEFSLLADGVQMDKSGVVSNPGFLEEENNKKFEALDDNITPNATIKGWLGFYVDENAKELELKVKNVTIKMDNPVYKK